MIDDQHTDYERDIVAYWNGLSKVEFWRLSQGDVQNLMDEAVEEIERLRRERDMAREEIAWLRERQSDGRDDGA